MIVISTMCCYNKYAKEIFLYETDFRKTNFEKM